MNFSASYASVPFLADVGKHVPMPSATAAVLRQQPFADVIDEINSKLPSLWLRDYAYPAAFPGRNLAGIAKHWQESSTRPPPDVPLNTYFYPHGACRWSVWRGLMTSGMVKVLLQGSGARPFVLQQEPDSPSDTGKPADYSVKTSLYMLPPRPLGEQGGSSYDGLYLITLVDERYWWASWPVLLHVNSQSTWQSLIQQIATAVNVTINPPSIPAAYSQPEPDSPLWANMEPAGILLDAIAYNLGCKVVRNLDGSYSFQRPIDAQNLLDTNTGKFSQVRVMGGRFFEGPSTKLPVGDLSPSRNLALPQTVNVTFPKYVIGNDPVPHFVNPHYANPRPSAWIEDSYGDVWTANVTLAANSLTVSGGVIVSGNPPVGTQATHVIHTTAKALYSGEANVGSSPLNSSGLTSLAGQLANDYWNGQAVLSADESYPGILNWSPEATHDIVWTFSARQRQATTRIVRSPWNESVQEMQHATIPVAGSAATSKGVGGPSVAQTIRDSTSGTFTTVLSQSFLSGDLVATFADVNLFPTQNRWRGQIDNEIILFEGTSGGTKVNVVYRAVDGTLPADHANSATVMQVLPNTNYGTNLITFEKGQHTYSSDWTSGGIQGLNVVPQLQTVQVLSSSGLVVNSGTLVGSGQIVGSGQVITSGTFSGQISSGTISSGSITGGVAFYSGQLQLWNYVSGSWDKREPVWLFERNNFALVSGIRYGAHFQGYGVSGYVAPVYATTDNVGGGTAGTFLHNLLSPTHPDTVPYTPPVKGDMVVGTEQAGAIQYFTTQIRANDPLSVTLPTPPQPGDTVIVVCIFKWVVNVPGQPPTIDDNQGNSGYAPDAVMFLQNVPSTSLGLFAGIFRQSVTAAANGDWTITANTSGVVQGDLIGLEAFHLQGSAVVDQAATNSGSGNQPSLTFAPGTTKDFVLAVVAVSDNSVLIKEPTGFFDMQTETNGTDYCGGQVVCALAVPPANLQWTVSPTPAHFAAAGVAYKVQTSPNLSGLWQRFKDATTKGFFLRTELSQAEGMKWEDGIQLTDSSVVVIDNKTYNITLIRNSLGQNYSNVFFNIYPNYLNSWLYVRQFLALGIEVIPFNVAGNGGIIQIDYTSKILIPPEQPGDPPLGGNPAQQAIIGFTPCIDGQLLYVQNLSSSKLILIGTSYKDLDAFPRFGELSFPSGWPFEIYPDQEICFEGKKGVWHLVGPDLFVPYVNFSAAASWSPQNGLVPRPPSDLLLRFLSSIPTNRSDPTTAWRRLSDIVPPICTGVISSKIYVSSVQCINGIEVVTYSQEILSYQNGCVVSTITVLGSFNAGCCTCTPPCGYYCVTCSDGSTHCVQGVATNGVCGPPAGVCTGAVINVTGPWPTATCGNTCNPCPYDCIQCLSASGLPNGNPICVQQTIVNGVCTTNLAPCAGMGRVVNTFTTAAQCNSNTCAPCPWFCVQYYDPGSGLPLGGPQCVQTTPTGNAGQCAIPGQYFYIISGPYTGATAQSDCQKACAGCPCYCIQCYNPTTGKAQPPQCVQYVLVNGVCQIPPGTCPTITPPPQQWWCVYPVGGTIAQQGCQAFTSPPDPTKWVVVAGPYPDQGTCGKNCQNQPCTTCCSVAGPPSSWTVIFSGGTGVFACVNGTWTVPANYIGQAGGCLCGANDVCGGQLYSAACNDSSGNTVNIIVNPPCTGDGVTTIGQVTIIIYDNKGNIIAEADYQWGPVTAGDCCTGGVLSALAVLSGNPCRVGCDLGVPPPDGSIQPDCSATQSPSAQQAAQLAVSQQSYTVLGGPYANCGLCAAPGTPCGGTGIQTNCCPKPIPATLTLNFNKPFTNCLSCINFPGSPLPLIYQAALSNPAQGIWVWQAALPGCNTSVGPLPDPGFFRLICNNGTWGFCWAGTVNGPCVVTGSVIVIDCSPFSATWACDVGGAPCDGTISQ